MAQAVTPLNRDPQLDALKLPPHSLEAEQSVLGGLLLDNEAWEKIGDVLRDEDFYRADHRQIYRHIADLIDDNKPADALTSSLRSQLRSRRRTWLHSRRLTTSRSRRPSSAAC